MHGFGVGSHHCAIISVCLFMWMWVLATQQAMMQCVSHKLPFQGPPILGHFFGYKHQQLCAGQMFSPNMGKKWYSPPTKHAVLQLWA